MHECLEERWSGHFERYTLAFVSSMESISLKCIRLVGPCTVYYSETMEAHGVY